MITKVYFLTALFTFSYNFSFALFLSLSFSPLSKNRMYHFKCGKCKNVYDCFSLESLERKHIDLRAKGAGILIILLFNLLTYFRGSVNLEKNLSHILDIKSIPNFHIILQTLNKKYFVAFYLINAVEPFTENNDIRLNFKVKFRLLYICESLCGIFLIKIS